MIPLIRVSSLWDQIAREDEFKSDRIQRFIETRDCLEQRGDSCETLLRHNEGRIGSPSENGQVFRMKCGSDIALKIMPICYSTSQLENENELRLAKLLSMSVQRGESTHFPMVYASGYCDNVQLENDNFLKRYQLLTMANMIKEWSKEDKIKLNDILTMNYETGEYDVTAEIDLTADIDRGPGNIVGQLREIFQDNINDTHTKLEKIMGKFSLPTLPAHILYSELANMDLKQYLGQFRVSDEKYREILVQVIKAVKELQSHRIVHNDFHLGNVLVVIQNDSLLLLIHDFGKSFQREVLSEEDKLIDMRVMFKCLEKIATPSQLEIIKEVRFLGKRRKNRTNKRKNRRTSKKK
jgi:hypothetical protein